MNTDAPHAAAASPVLSADQIEARLRAELPHWRLADGAIAREVRTSGWKATLMAVNTIGHLAEAAWHHPDLAVSFDRVGIRLSTHDAGGITEKDLALAAMVERVLMWRPGAEPGAALEGTPDEPRWRYISYD